MKKIGVILGGLLLALLGAVPAQAGTSATSLVISDQNSGHSATIYSDKGYCSGTKWTLGAGRTVRGTALSVKANVAYTIKINNGSWRRMKAGYCVDVFAATFGVFPKTIYITTS